MPWLARHNLEIDWKTVETGVGEVRMEEAERRRSKGRGREKERRKEEEKEIEKGKDDGGKESSRRMGNMGRRRGSSKVRGRGEEASAGKISPMDKGVWEETVGKDADKEVVGSHDRCEGGVYAMKREGVPFVEKRKGGG